MTKRQDAKVAKGNRRDQGPDPTPARSVGLLCVMAVLAFTATVAHGATPGDQVPRRGLAWSPLWPRFRYWEYAGTAALGLTALYFEKNGAPPVQPRWRGGILFDGAVRGWLAASSEQGRATARKLSDVLWLGGSAYPFVIDLPVALFVHRQPGVAWQMTMMNLEAYAVTGLVNRVLEFEVGRARPSVGPCAIDPEYDGLCGSASNNASFPSGHTLGIATAAGLTCVHHRYLPLYGHPMADAAPCVLLSAATAVTGVARMVADRHHATDVLFGAGFGFAVGYGLPWLLHYRHGTARPGEGRQTSIHLLPWTAASALGAAVVGGL
jgi:membrane-associated phospholipid phosphatase